MLGQGSDLPQSSEIQNPGGPSLPKEFRMLAGAACQLTTKDFTILEAMLERQNGRDDPVVPILKRKLSSASVVFRETVHPDVVTLNSRVAFRVDDGPSITRIVVQGEPRGMVGMTLPITVPRGLTLLGMAKGRYCVGDATRRFPRNNPGGGRALPAGGCETAPRAKRRTGRPHRRAISQAGPFDGYACVIRNRCHRHSGRR